MRFVPACKRFGAYSLNYCRVSARSKAFVPKDPCFSALTVRKSDQILWYELSEPSNGIGGCDTGGDSSEWQKAWSALDYCYVPNYWISALKKPLRSTIKSVVVVVVVACKTVRLKNSKTLSLYREAGANWNWRSQSWLKYSTQLSTYPFSRIHIHYKDFNLL